MRLINTTTLELESFTSSTPPAYAILSHRWHSDSTQEVNLKDIRKRRDVEEPRFAKIRKFCDVARSRGLQYAWVDTCCIDQRASAELQECLNSMYRFYAHAKLCCAFLADVEQQDEWSNSVWWTRGWTLQELLAPQNVEFYDKRWELITTRNERATEISQLTSIPEDVLTQAYFPAASKHLVGERTSWAAGRTTERIEDRAYCLLGIFDVHIGTVYGEGERAFKRLQYAILEQTADESILGWPSCSPVFIATGIESPAIEVWLSSDTTSALARSPQAFTKPRSSLAKLTKGTLLGPHRVSPPQRTSWGISFCADLLMLTPRDHIRGLLAEIPVVFVFSLSINHCIIELYADCALLLVPRGGFTTTPLRLRRLQAIYHQSDALNEYLAKHFVSHGLKKNVSFYLEV